MIKQLMPDQEHMTICLLHHIYGDLVSAKIRWYLFEKPTIDQRNRKIAFNQIGLHLIKSIRFEIK